MSSLAAANAPNSVDLCGRRLGRYEVLTMLASGGMATVYIARAQGVAGFERLVAVKVLHPHLAHDEDFISMFLDEARLAARIRHPNAVGTLDISDTQGDGYFLVMEYVEGDHFGALLRNAAKGGERLPVPVVARVLMDALAGLYAAHHLTDANDNPLDLVHRDVSPHNILIGADGVARITDFGVAKAQVRLSSTRDGQFKGKLSYMAPEQAASGQADQRSDLFSMGIVLWEALTGRRLFRGENNADVLNKILNPVVPAPSSFVEALGPFDAVTAKALARDPDDRYQDADEFLEAIEAAAAQIGGVATPRAVAREVKRWLGDKIQRERQQVRDSMDALGRSELTPGVLPRPMEGGSQPSHPGAASLVRPIANDDHTVGAKPSTMASTIEDPPSSSKTAWIAAVVVLSLLLVGGGLAFVLLGPGDDRAAAAPANVAEEPVVEEPVVEEPVVEEPVAPSAQPQTGVAAAADDAPPEGTGDGTAEPTDEQVDDEQVDDEQVDDEQGATAEERSLAARVRARRLREARRRARERAARRGESGSSNGSGGSPDDDDLLLNPYRR